MKNNERRLRFLLKVFGYKAFYSCSIYDSGIHVQGMFSPEMVKMVTRLRFKYDIDQNGYLKYTRGVYEITFTD